MIGKFVAFGIGYKDSQGIIIDEGEKYFVIKYIKSRSITAEFKSLVKIFDTEKEMNEWISAQGYQYDPR